MKGETFMHYTGTIWRPPFESNSALLQITCGCTHHLCKFCSLYDVDFQMSPMSEIETDLEELSHFHSGATRVFMTGANPMVLSFDKLRNLLIKIKHYLSEVKTIGGFARITDLVPKSIEQLKELHSLGLDSISIVLYLITGCREKSPSVPHSLVLPNVDEITSIDLDTIEKLQFSYSDKEWIEPFMFIFSAGHTTNKTTVQGLPIVDNYEQIDIVCDNKVSTIFYYEGDNKYYIEQSYQGIYEIDRNIEDMIVQTK